MEIKNLKVTLDEKILAAPKVLIVPHNQVDFDAIGSSIGLSLVVKKLKKHPMILVNDSSYQIDYGVKSIIDDVSKEIEIVNKSKYSEMKEEDDLYILSDVNKKYLISIDEYLKNPDNVVIIDHHEEDEQTVISNNKYIDYNLSSASEIITKLLELYKIKIPCNVADYLLAGIYLDTNKLTKGVNPTTMKMVAKLLENGANISRVNDLFAEDFLSDRRVHELVNKAKFISYTIAILASNEDEIYTNQELAKAADYALKYRVDASFAVGKVDDDTVSVNGRSKEKVDISRIMKDLGGGGNLYSGAAKIKNVSVEETAKKLIKKLQPSYYVENNE